MPHMVLQYITKGAGMAPILLMASVKAPVTLVFTLWASALSKK